MKAKDIKQLATDELITKVAESKESLKKLKFAHAISPIENPSQIRVIKKEIAQLLTEKSARTNSNK